MSECIENKGTCDSVLSKNIVSDRNCNRGIGDLFGDKSSLLFFFLLLVIIFCNCGIFKASSDSLLFFFLLLVVLFTGGSWFR